MVDASGFEILVAIDLRGGRVVRLTQGDFEHETAFSDDPAATARAFVDAGVRWLHVVDLDGARSGRPILHDVIAEIMGTVQDSALVEIAGGLRTHEAVDRMFAIGARRVVVGTAAIRKPRFAGELVERWGSDSVAVAVDVRGGHALGDGWSTSASDDDPATVIARLADRGVSTFEVTAIDRDGTLRGPDLDLYTSLVGAGRGAIIASGGISTLDDLRAVRDVGCVGAIVGRTIYEGRLSVADALTVTSGQ
jgi:phosphoribosylformimino-5-aminoimidazole carboxamide ribotide isomerase